MAIRRLTSGRIRANCVTRLVISSVLATIVLRGVDGKHVSPPKRRLAVEELKRLVPPPTSRELGGEKADDGVYSRFLSVAGWDPAKAAPKLEEDFEWRKRLKPRQIRPKDCPTLSRQHAWKALTNGSVFIAPGGSSAKVKRSASQKQIQSHLALDPPHTCPPMQSWRTTKHGFPITYFQCWMWRPDKASKKECEKHIAYHMDHCIRRMKRNVSRGCIVFDLRGFETWMLPYILASINVLVVHYPCRAGAVCFINVPAYFHPFWKVFNPCLDDDIRSRTFFAPETVDDCEKAISFINKKSLESGL